MGKYKDKAKSIYGFMGELSKDVPGVAKGFMAVHKANSSDGALNVKQKELIALGIAIGVRCEGCIASHMATLLRVGATKEEIMETIGVAIMMGGGPAISYGTIAYEAMNEMLEK